MFTLEITSAIQESQSIDEGVHLSAGFSYWHNRLIELNPEHPPFVKLIAAALILPLNPNYIWQNLTDINQWDVARTFFYNIGNNADFMLFLGRLPTMFYSILLGWLIFIWTRKLANSKAAIFALLLYIFDANILAHSRYITTDIAASLTFISSLYFLHQYTIKPDRKNFFIFITIFALGQIVKFSTIMLWPIIIIYGFYSKINAKQLFRLIIGMSLATFIVIFIAYFGHPETYFTGLSALADHEKGGHYSYLLGNFDKIGFWYYFPVAFIVKTPITTLILFILAAILFLSKNLNVSSWQSTKNNFQQIPLVHWLIIIFPLFYFIASMINRINIGIRHLLPIYPFIFIFIALVFFNENFKTKYIKIASGFLILFFIAESCLVYPNYLSYFSLLVGSTPQGYKYLLDSNLDWGQDLKKLKKYLDDNQIAEPIYLDYFGQASPSYYKINYSDMRSDVKTGWIAMSIQSMMWEDSQYKWLLDKKPIAVIGDSIYLYHIQK